MCVFNTKSIRTGQIENKPSQIDHMKAPTAALPTLLALDSSLFTPTLTNNIVSDARLPHVFVVAFSSDSSVSEVGSQGSALSHLVLP